MYKSFKSIVSDVDEKGQVVVAANSFGNVDSQSDISIYGSFTKTLKENFDRVKWFLNHNPNILLGVPMSATETPQYLQIVGKLNLNKEIGRDIYEDYKLYAEYGKTLEHSIGVDAIKYEIQGNVRKVNEWRLWEFSTLTNWGANENTPMLAIKSDIDFLNIKLEKGKYTDEKFTEIEKQIQILKSLIEEPSIDTPTTEPIDWKGLSTIFINSLK
jgi:HK97 family phage prohead protease